MSKSSRDYWREREEEARKHTISDEEEYRKRLAEIYLKMQTNISREIDGFYGRYAAKNDITMDDARKRASKADMEALALKAKQYVAEKDFSDQANEEMALYNLTMKVNRLELLKAQMGLELLAGYSDAEREIGKDILRTAMKEYERMAGVLGNSVKDAEKYAHALVNASFRHATFSDRLWNSENKLKNELERILRIGLIQGRNPNAMSPQIEKAFGVGQREAIRLVITEMCRVQTEVQKQSYERNGYEEYEFITEPDERLCDECRDLDGKIFKVRDMQPGHNAPPIHPFCRCSTAPHADRERLDELIRRFEEERGEGARRGVEDRQREYSSSANLVQRRTTAVENRNRSRQEYYDHPAFRNAHFKTGGLSPKEYALSKYEKEVVNFDRDGIINLTETEFVKSEFADISHLQGRIGNYEVRLWYAYHVEHIKDYFHEEDSLETQARIAFSLRNEYRTNARLLMSDKSAVENLNATKKNRTFEELVAKASLKGLSGDDIYKDIIRSSMHHNEEYDKKAGI